jgi:hypothetical protein
MSLVTKILLSFNAAILIAFNIYVNFSILIIEQNLTLKGHRINKISNLVDSIYQNHNIENVSDSLILELKDTLEIYDYLALFSERKANKNLISKLQVEPLKSAKIILLEGNYPFDTCLNKKFCIQNLELKFEIITSTLTDISELGIFEDKSEHKKVDNDFKTKQKNAKFGVRSANVNFNIKDISSGSLINVTFNSKNLSFGKNKLSLVLKNSNTSLVDYLNYRFSEVYLVFYSHRKSKFQKEDAYSVKIEIVKNKKKTDFPITELTSWERRHINDILKLGFSLFYQEKVVFIKDNIPFAQL